MESSLNVHIFLTVQVVNRVLFKSYWKFVITYMMICNQASVENSWDFSQVEKSSRGEAQGPLCGMCGWEPTDFRH